MSAARISSQKFSSVFALEHGLDPVDRQRLTADLSIACQGEGLSEDSWLPWVVHAAEVGYEYSGLEFWPTFAARTQGWRDGSMSRDWIRNQFFRFHLEYRGVKPEGEWASWFSIICWPITNAILPQDLQWQFVTSLTRLAARFSYGMLRDPSRLGTEIQLVSPDASSRFRQFVKNAELVGLIASALLLQDEHPEFEILAKDTLERIVEDLDRKRHGRELLNQARDQARRSVAIKGVGRERYWPAVTTGDEPPTLGRLGICPDIVMRLDNEGRWSAFLQIPDISSVAAFLTADVRDALLEHRFKIPCAQRARPFAAGALMQGISDVLLRAWPEPGTPLVKFEQPSPIAEQLLDSRLCIGEGPLWLFRLREDSEAREVRSRTVRTGGQYLLLSKTSLSLPQEVERQETTLENAQLWLLDSQRCSADLLISICDACDLQSAWTARIWPTGLPPSRWDGEGNIEWLLTQPKTVGLLTDFDGTFAFRDTGPCADTLVLQVRAGIPSLVDLDPLELGEHIFELALTAGGSEQTGRLRVVVREPSVGPPDHFLPMRVSLSPRTPTLQELWANRFSLEVEGPCGLPVRFMVEFQADGIERPLWRCPLPSLKLPLGAAEWRDHWETHVIGSEKAQRAYDVADSCTIQIDGRELGTRLIEAEREWAPLRWVLHREEEDYCLHLRDDRGETVLPEVAKCTYDAPDNAHRVDPVPFISEGCRDPAGGLYVSRASNCLASIVMPRRVRGFADLSCTPRLLRYERTAADCGRLIQCLSVWRRAAIPGQLAALLPYRQVISAFECTLLRTICGEKWGNAERAFSADPSSRTLELLGQAVAAKPDEQSLAKALVAQATALCAGTAQERSERLALLIRSGVGYRKMNLRGQFSLAYFSSLTEFSLRLSSGPETAITWAGKHAPELLADILRLPVFVRAARWLVLCADYSHSTSDHSRMHPAWDW